MSATGTFGLLLARLNLVHVVEVQNDQWRACIFIGHDFI